MENNKDIKDYLHLYGTGVIVFFDNQKWRVTEFRRKTVRGIRTDQSHSNEFYYNDCKPILRPLSDMTEEDLKEQEKIISIYVKDFNVTDDDRKFALQRIKDKGMGAMGFDDANAEMIFEVTRLLLKQGFDLFNLIPEGLAIDKTKITDHGKQ